MILLYNSNMYLQMKRQENFEEWDQFDNKYILAAASEWWQGFPPSCMQHLAQLCHNLSICRLPCHIEVLLRVIYHAVQLRVTLACAPVRRVVVVAVVRDPHPFCVAPLSRPHAIPHRVLQVVNNLPTSGVLPEDSFLPVRTLWVFHKGHQAGTLGTPC